jgi:hypothetical protein
MDNKQIHFSISKSTLILVSILIGVLLVIIACLLGRMGKREGMMMRQGQNSGYMRTQGQGKGMTGPGRQNMQQPQAQPDMQGQPTSGAVETGAVMPQ